jgi:integrase/recombinase XerD
MIKTLFLSGARVDEFVHIRVEDLHLDGDPPQIHLCHCKKESNRYVLKSGFASPVKVAASTPQTA